MFRSVAGILVQDHHPNGTKYLFDRILKRLYNEHNFQYWIDNGLVEINYSRKIICFTEEYFRKQLESRKEMIGQYLKIKGITEKQYAEFIIEVKNNDRSKSNI